MRNTIYASFVDSNLAERAAGALLDHGLRPEDLSIIQSHREKPKTAEEIAPQQPPVALITVPNVSGMSTGVSPFGMAPMVAVDEDTNTIEDVSTSWTELEDDAKAGLSVTTAQDAGSGAMHGVAWGVGVGAVAALSSLFVPGIGLVIGGGALATAIAGAVATAGAGAAAGAVTGYLKDQGVESHVVAQYEAAVDSGGAVLGATLPSGNVDEARAWEILSKYSGQQVKSYVDRPYVS